MDILKAVGERIRIIRKGQGLSQEDLAEKCGLTSNYIGFVERGQKQVTLVTLKSVADALGVDIGALFEGLAVKGKKSPTEIEITALNEAARRIDLEKLKALRKVAEGLAEKNKGRQ